MKKILLLVCLIAIVALVLGCTQYTSSNSPPATGSSNGGTTGGNGAPVGGNTGSTGTTNGAQTISVTIQNFSFVPSDLHVKAGDTVVWTNNDSMAHTVTSDSGSELGSSQIATGSTYPHTFNTAGTYPYHCSIHPSMTATVIVQ